MASLPSLFDIKRENPPLEGYVSEQIEYQRGLDLKKLEEIKALSSIVKPTPDVKEMHSRLTELGRHGYSIIPHSTMNKKEVVDYYRTVRNYLEAQLFEAEYNLSFYDCPEPENLIF